MRGKGAVKTSLRVIPNNIDYIVERQLVERLRLYS